MVSTVDFVFLALFFGHFRITIFVEREAGLTAFVVVIKVEFDSEQVVMVVEVVIASSESAGLCCLHCARRWRAARVVVFVGCANFGCCGSGEKFLCLQRSLSKSRAAPFAPDPCMRNVLERP